MTMFPKLSKNKEEAAVVAPFVNMYDQDQKIVLAVEMPGVDKATLEVYVNHNELIIKGKKKKEDVGKEYQLIYQERTVDEYERRFEINTQIDSEKIDAQYKDGILKITLARSAAAQPKKITIKT